jgi:hypothetical protein
MVDDGISPNVEDKRAKGTEVRNMKYLVEFYDGLVLDLMVNKFTFIFEFGADFGLLSYVYVSASCC